MSDDKKQKHKEEYESLLAIFINFLKNIHSGERTEIAEELMELRADLAIEHAFTGFGIDVEEAMQLLSSKYDENLTQQDKDKRDRLIAAVNNLIDFAVCEEYQVLQRATDLYSDKLSDEQDYDIDFDNPDEVAEYIGICSLYNDTYASVENGDIEYAMLIASKWIQVASNEYLTYMTMNDNKVRPHHMELQGYTAKRDDFPAWMIPPIEWNCRCFLENVSGTYVVGKVDMKDVMAKAPKKPDLVDNVFSDSVAKCGKIFNDCHPYFSVDENDKKSLQVIVEKIRRKYAQ